MGALAGWPAGWGPPQAWRGLSFTELRPRTQAVPVTALRTATARSGLVLRKRSVGFAVISMFSRKGIKHFHEVLSQKGL